MFKPAWVVLACCASMGVTALQLNEENAERLIDVALNITKGQGGEAAVGLGAGVVLGFVVNKLQGAVVTAALSLSLGTGIAVHQGWVGADVVQLKVAQIVKGISQQVMQQAARLDVNGDGRLTIEDSNIAASRVAPFVKKHPGLTGGLVGGLVAGYRLL